MSPRTACEFKRSCASAFQYRERRLRVGGCLKVTKLKA